MTGYLCGLGGKKLMIARNWREGEIWVGVLMSGGIGGSEKNRNICCLGFTDFVFNNMVI
jgi:hypothetical protein